MYLMTTFFQLFFPFIFLNAPRLHSPFTGSNTDSQQNDEDDNGNDDDATVGRKVSRTLRHILAGNIICLMEIPTGKL